MKKTAAKPSSKSDPEALTGERKAVHGDWHVQSMCANRLKYTADHYGVTYANLPAFQKEAIDMILTKVSRILCGDHDHVDHWDDIAGYAYLGKGGHNQ